MSGGKCIKILHGGEYIIIIVHFTNDGNRIWYRKTKNAMKTRPSAVHEYTALKLD